ncbi:echinoderm microtubule-associated protein-like 6 isoform X2 [Homarus americanus]|nr:echinoderm microtubule-associated protein-like 6 isoform X2 [Homarus americanus]XP_042240212.1 echinoderm microtubule-associated protein-like 6 isoform X2 [Homarus americanus]XP_042240214.1 echinoderm microtubule-associated protein-like 6 isoform X2 [Homarus americanus]
MGSRQPPDGSLELVWVFGYNGHTARNNVKINKDGHLVYYVAGVGVVHDITLRKQTFYTGHNNDITSLAMTGDMHLAATGQVGKDAYITVWDTSTRDPISVIRDGHTHRVSTLSFSSDKKLLASVGGPDHKQELMVWEWHKGRRLAYNIAFSGRVEEVEWEPGSNSRLVTCGHNHVRFWKLSGNVIQGNSGVFGKETTCDQVSVSHMPDNRVVTGTSTGHLYIWSKSKLVSAIKDVHPGGVLVTEVYSGGLLSGGKDGTIGVFDKQLNRVSTVPGAPSLVYEVAGPIHSLAVHNEKIIVGTEKNEVWTVKVEHDGGLGAACVVQGHGLGEVWGLATHPTRSVAITASDDHTVRLWDLEERRPMTTIVVEKAARAAAFSPDGQDVAVGLSHGIFIILQAEHLEEKYRISDRKEVRHDLKYSPCGETLAVASNDNFVDIYKVDKEYERIYVLKGASSFITHLDWSSDCNYLQLNSGDGERLLYNVAKESLVDESDIPGVEWSSWTGVLGPQVKGIWHKYADLSDVNACDANFYFGVMVTGDDYGLVKLFRFPCPKKGSKGRSVVGHSAHVTNVRWTSDSEYVVSVGGADHAVFLWKFRSSRRISAPHQTVRLPSAVEGESEDDIIDTEDELEGIPELTQDLEQELAVNRRKTGTRRQNKNGRGNRPVTGVEIAEESTFTRRRNAKSGKAGHDTPPPQCLRIKHVFGYHAHECRNNAHWLKDGQVVYHVAAIGVAIDPSTGVQKHYLHHTDDILCLAVHPQGQLVASGQIGREATVHVWDATDMRIMSLLQGGHMRGVSSVAFSGDGERVASLGLDDYHTVVIWNWLKGYKIASARGHSDKVFGMRFSPTNNNRLVTFGIKHIKFWSQAGGGLTYRQVVLGPKFKQNTVLCSSVGGGEGASEWWLLGLSSGYVFVVKDAKVERSVKAHKVPVYAILVTQESIWTAGQGGYVCKWDSEMKRSVKVFPVTDHFLENSAAFGLTSSQPGLRSLSAAPGTDFPLLVATQHAEILLMDADGMFTVLVQGHSKGEVWGLDTHPRLLEAVTVGGDNTLRRWSLEDYDALASANLRKTACCVHFHPSAVLLSLGYLDGSVALYLYPSLVKHGGVHHRSEGISDVKFSPDGRFLAVGSHERVVDIYVVDTDGDIVSQEGSGLRRVGICRGASSWVTHLTWHENSRLIQINTGAGEQLFYEAPHGTRQLIPDSTTAELAWTSPLTCPLDATVEGVWAPDMDLTDINAIATAHNLPVVATVSDEEGLVRLFRYPCMGGLKKHRQYRGHSAHVTNVKWVYDNSLIVTTGGGDTSVIVWKVRQGSLKQDKEDTLHSPQNGEHTLDDLPDEDLTIMDLEAAGLDDDDVPLIVHTTSTKDRKSTRTPGKTREPQSHRKRSAGQLRSIPTLTPDDKKAFYCSGSAVGQLNIAEGGEMEGQRLVYGEHTAAITFLALSVNDPKMIATAQLGMEGDVSEDNVENFALVHVWRPSDGTNVAVLRGGKETIITALSFSPSGRFLASLADASTVHVFNWIKGAHIAHSELKVGMVTAMAHTGETTLAVLTPRTVLFLDLVGNSLITTRGHASPDLLPDDAAFNGLGVSPNGRVYVGCSDGSVVEWKGRIATRRIMAPDEPPIISPVRMSIAVGQGAVFTACRLGSIIVVRCYTTDDDELHFFSDSKIATPEENWIPVSARLGGAMLILGARRNQPLIILDLKSGKFTLIDQG